MTFGNLSLNRQREGVWATQFTAHNGVTLKSQIAVEPGTQDQEHQMVLRLLREAGISLGATIVDENA